MGMHSDKALQFNWDQKVYYSVGSFASRDTSVNVGCLGYCMQSPSRSL